MCASLMEARHGFAYSSIVVQAFGLVTRCQLHASEGAVWPKAELGQVEQVLASISKAELAKKEPLQN